MKEDIAQETLELALKYADEAEVYLETEEKIEVNIQNQKVDFAKETSSYGLGIRVIKDNRMGFAHTTDLSKLKKTVENAVFNAKCNEDDLNFYFAPPSEYPQVHETFDKKIRDLEMEEAVHFAKIMIQTSIDKECQPTSGGVQAGCFHTQITNSEGVSSQDSSTYFAGYISVNVPDGEGVSTAHESDASRFLDLDPVEISREACQLALDSRGGKSTEIADLNVLLDCDAAASLIFTLANAFNADNVQRGRSIYADKVGKQVLSPSLNIYDDGTLKKGLNSSISDGEGSPSQKTVLIKEGILENFVYDLYTSRKSEVQSTGNGMRSSFADTPAVGLSNFIMDFNERKEISEIKNGLMVKDLLGAHTANPISGDFSVEAMNAFKIEDGEIAYPVRKAMLSGNIFKAFTKAWAASTETKQIGPFVLPPIVLSKLRVVG
ncbi:MAG TPA: TldD/PmbA family protein [Methanobacterium sp.]